MENERNYGLDLFRIMAMLMITVLHVNFQHFNLLNRQHEPGIYTAGYLIEYICFCGVNCFALLSGYLAKPVQGNFDRKWFRRILDLWLKIIFWGIPLYLGWVLISPEVSFDKELFRSLIFAGNSEWWYIQSYFGLLIFLPVFSGITSRFSIAEQVRFLIITFVLFTILPRVLRYPDIFEFRFGYSTLWLIACFLWGEILRELAPEIQKWKHSTVFLSITAVLCALLPCLYHLTARYFGLGDHAHIFFSYTSPFCVLEAGALLLLFRKIQIKNGKIQKLLLFLSVNSLGIYLIQCHPMIWKTVILRDHSVPEIPDGLYWKYPLLVMGIMLSGIGMEYLIRSLCGIRIFTAAREFLAELIFPGKKQ